MLLFKFIFMKPFSILWLLASWRFKSP